MDELLKDFLTETTEHIEGAETQLVQFERNPTDASLISSIFRLVHTIKGTSSFLGLERLKRVGHAAESVMGMLRDGVPPTQHSVTIILAAIDRIKNIIEDIARTGSEPAEDDSEIIAALEAYYAAGSAAPVEDAAPAAASTPEPVHVQETPVHAPAVAAAEAAAPAAPVAAAPAAQPERDDPQRHGQELGTEQRRL
jgi:two-component system chemotaxis sensor kinase CheA